MLLHFQVERAIFCFTCAVMEQKYYSRRHMMKEVIIRNIRMEMQDILNESQLNKLHEVLVSSFSEVIITPKEAIPSERTSTDYVKLYLAAKKIEGCSEKTLRYYETTIRKMTDQISKDVCEISTDDLRIYLAYYQESHHAGKVTTDNIRRIISGFFAWLEDENYLLKSPARRIHKIKTAQVIKDTFSDENLEILKSACTNIRDLALVDFLASTGVRVGEVVKLNRQDMNFSERSCIVFGKGDKEREIYFDASTKLHLQSYLKSRTDTNDALFVSRNFPYQRLSINGIEKMLSRLGEHAQIPKVHPHKFRRTLATMAIDKGMPVEQVQQLLGHVRIDTTMHYAMVNQANVKNAHRKYIG